MTLSSEAFECFANGCFSQGLEMLQDCEPWTDHNPSDQSLGGPFFLGFPCAKGWGEALLFASLLKRVASSREKPICVYARPEVCSILRKDPTFNVFEVCCHNEAKGKGARSPLSILCAALDGDLLDQKFEPLIDPCRPDRRYSAPSRVGVAWASVDDKDRRILEKSIPLTYFHSLLPKAYIDIVSFQRKPNEISDSSVVRDLGWETISSETLECRDQRNVACRIRELDAMVTVSTTTAHIAATLGISTVLLMADRPHQQWFWKAQLSGKEFYPSVRVVMGEKGETWWCSSDFSTRAKSAVHEVLNPLSYEDT